MNLTVRQAAERLGLSIPRIKQLIHQGRIVATKHGRDWSITERDLAKADLADRRK